MSLKLKTFHCPLFSSLSFGDFDRSLTLKVIVDFPDYIRHARFFIFKSVAKTLPDLAGQVILKIQIFVVLASLMT